MVTCTSDSLPSVTSRLVNSHKQHVVLSTYVSCPQSKLNNLCGVFTDTELTFNYNLHCVGNRRATCNCGSDNCSGFLGVQPTVRSSSSNYHAGISRAILFFCHCFDASLLLLISPECCGVGERGQGQKCQAKAQEAEAAIGGQTHSRILLLLLWWGWRAGDVWQERLSQSIPPALSKPHQATIW